MSDAGEETEVMAAMAKDIYRYLLKHDYTDNDDHITDVHHQAKEKGALAELPDSLKPYEAQIG